LVAWEPEDLKSAVFEFIVHFLETLKLGGKTTLAGCVHDEQYFAFVLGERFFFSAQGVGLR
jgi:hypothetical protein